MFGKRINNIRQEIIKETLDASLISSISNITYLTGYANFSEKEREAYLLIGKDFQYIITDARYSEAVKRQVPHLTLYERSHQKSTEALFKKLKRKIKRLGIEEDNLTVSEHKVLLKHFKSLKHFNTKNLRSIKNKEEVEKINKAAKLGDQTFEYILPKIKPGITEKKLAWEIEKFVKDKGGELSFPSIVAFGKNSSVPHHHTGKDILKRDGGFVLLDFGVKFENYCSDMTRTIFFGQPNSQQKKIYETVLAAQKKAVEFIAKQQTCFINLQIKSGEMVKASEVDRVAREYIVSKGFPTIPHSLGHGIGLEVHEHPSLSPNSKDILKEGMVFSIEPGIYLPDFGGVRIEDLFLLEKGQLRQITSSPKDIISI